MIGLGANGLATLKNLLEEDFDATGFDSNEYVGGIWHAISDPKLSTLPTTVVNVSRERACFTDFPFAEGTSSYPTAAQVDNYLNDYCTQFSLWPKLRLGHCVSRIERDEGQNQWCLDVTSREGKESLVFDTVVIATGPHSVPVMPILPGSEGFQGEILHSRDFKDATNFRDKTVVVVAWPTQLLIQLRDS